MGDKLEFTTWPMQKHIFYKNTSGAQTVEIKGQRNAVIGLARKPSKSCDFWIIIGEGNNNCYIAIGNENKVKLSLPYTLSPEEYRPFAISWHSGRVTLQAQLASPPQAISLPAETQHIKYVTFIVCSRWNASPICWRVEMPPQRPTRPMKAIGVGSLTWVSSSQIDRIPFEALIGGYDKETLYIIRAPHRHSLTPGKFVPSLGEGFIAWGGAEHAKNEFDILCGWDVSWVWARGDVIPVGAVPGGRSETGETLYVGRAPHEHCLIPGKVQPSHKCCYIPYDGREIGKSKFQVLVSPFSDRYAAHQNMIPKFDNLVDNYNIRMPEDVNSDEDEYLSEDE